MREISIYAKVAAIIIIILLVIGGAVSAIKGNEEKEIEDIVAENTLEVEDIAIESVAEEKYEPVFEKFEWQEHGYASLEEWYDDMKLKNDEAVGIADEIIGKYSGYVTDEQKDQLRECEKVMTTTLVCSDYDDAKSKFDGIVEDLIVASTPKPEPAPSPSTGSNNSNNYGGSVYDGGFNIPYNFKVMGILYDSQWRYSYYSSQVLYHYMTPQWTLGSDGIYRDSAGRVVVACDSLPYGTVIETELFGTCIVLDCGVGRGDTLDVYCAW